MGLLICLILSFVFELHVPWFIWAVAVLLGFKFNYKGLSI